MPAGEGKTDLLGILRNLAQRDITSVVIEAGPTLNFEALRLGCVDKILCFVAPKILGGQSPLPLAGGSGFIQLDRCMPLRFASIERVGDDLLVEAYADRQNNASHKNL
jgi:diaminohydroxyphosphoribosylaminopyrimidine deaminase/5-amino-6-(5-phosphoribosylamino)uracil reductase